MGVHRKPRESEHPERLKAERAAQLVCTACVMPTPAAELRLKHIPGVGATPLCRWCAEDVSSIEDMLCRLNRRAEMH